jgi:uncharacterized protein with PIN domain
LITTLQVSAAMKKELSRCGCCKENVKLKGNKRVHKRIEGSLPNNPLFFIHAD